MLCRVCNTRIGEGARSCPNCGRAPKSSALGARPSVGGIDPGEVTPLSRLVGGGEDVSLDHEVSGRSGPLAPAGRAPAARHPDPSETGVAALGPARLRDLLADNPDLLEPGLRPYADEKSRPVGVGYVSGVGEIDLLGVDAGGGLVVAIVAGEGEKGGDLVAAILSRVGWVRKHLCRPGQEVRGIVLVESRPDDLGYTAAAVADTVTFKTWRMTVLLEDIEV